MRQYWERNKGVIAAEAEAFGLDVALVVRVELGDGLPVELEVAADAVLSVGVRGWTAWPVRGGIWSSQAVP